MTTNGLEWHRAGGAIQAWSERINPLGDHIVRVHAKAVQDGKIPSDESAAFIMARSAVARGVIEAACVYAEGGEGALVSFLEELGDVVDRQPLAFSKDTRDRIRSALGR